MSRKLRLDVAQLTDVGRKRPHNEDNMAYVIPKDEQAMARKGALFIVADGMGGHAAGEVASEIAVDTVTKAYYEDEDEDISRSLINAIKRANTIIHQRADENSLRSGMGTTCVAAVLCGNMAYIANVGDSRAYIIRQTQVRQVSEDHSWVEEQVRAGLLTHDQARSHAQRNVITRCLGTQTDVEVDVFPELLSESDTLVLCTDGLSGSISEEDLCTIVNQFVPQESVYRLVERANENGGPDNITAIVIHVLEVGAELPLARYPVPAGTRQADADTAVLSPVSTSSLGFSPRTEDSSIWGSALEPATGPTPASSNSSPQSSEKPSLVQPARRRFFYPALALIVLIVVIVFGGGAYYVRSVNNSASQLSNARTFIDRANKEATQNPVDALQQLSSAQSTLTSAQGSFIGDQATQYKTLQANLNTALQTVIDAYNHKELITPLSCNTLNSLVPANTSPHPVSLSTLQDGNGSLFSYVLANDNNLYHLSDQKQLENPHQFGNNAHVVFMTGSSQHLFALTSSPGQSGSPTNYTVNMLSLNDQPPALKEELAPVDADLLKRGWVPTLLTAYGQDVYVVLTSRTIARKALLLYYDATNWQKPAQQVSISLVADIVSVAAFPGKQLFLLTSDGHIKGLLYPDQPDNNNPPLLDDVSLKSPIAPPLANDGKSADLAAPIPSESSQLGTSAKSGSTALVAGPVGDNAHLYLVDPANHRIVDLEFIAGRPVSVAQATPTATSTTPSNGAVSQPSLKVMHQITSKSLLSSVKNATVTANGKQLYLLTQNGGTLTTISSLDKTPSC